MKNNANKIYGLKGERISITPSSLQVGQIFHEVDSCSEYEWNSVRWIKSSEPCLGTPLRKFLTESFDGLGVYNLIGNYIVPTNFGYTVVDVPYTLHSLLFTITDNATFNALDYGGIANGLVNGISLWFKPLNSNPIPLVFNNPIKYNYEWFTHVANTNLSTFTGSTQTLVIPLDIIDDYGVPLTMLVGDSIYVTLNDNFTNLISNTFGIRGISH